ncbi:hypothetical protein ACUHMQ_11975 [Chitinimonas sp. PSY-7]|uniref:hypothetical protein n=1 Tax=Chitinimonas sp. PSY-7 TaxID=3459088 RepID=UPI0040402C72
MKKIAILLLVVSTTLKPAIAADTNTMSIKKFAAATETKAEEVMTAYIGVGVSVVEKIRESRGIGENYSTQVIDLKKLPGMAPAVFSRYKLISNDLAQVLKKAKNLSPPKADAEKISQTLPCLNKIQQEILATSDKYLQIAKELESSLITLEGGPLDEKSITQVLLLERQTKILETQKQSFSQMTRALLQITMALVPNE